MYAGYMFHQFIVEIKPSMFFERLKNYNVFNFLLLLKSTCNLNKWEEFIVQGEKLGSVHINDTMNKINDSNIIWDNGQCYFVMAWLRMLHVTLNCWLLSFICAHFFFNTEVLSHRFSKWTSMLYSEWNKMSSDTVNHHDWLVTKWIVATTTTSQCLS